MAREYAESAVETLVAIMSDDQKPARDRINAATEILDRGYGRPVERSAIASMNETDTQDYSKLDTRTLILLANKQFRPMEVDTESSQTTP